MGNESLAERILRDIQNGLTAEVLESDHTSILFRVTFRDGTAAQGVFYPKEWQLNGTEHDDFELGEIE